MDKNHRFGLIVPSPNVVRVCQMNLLFPGIK
jgi:hypothetical protein